MNCKVMVAGFVLIVVIAIILRSGREYGEISPRGYEIATALYSACNQKDPAKLETLSEIIEDSTGSRELNDRESRWLVAIIDQGRRGDWDAAVAEVRQIMKDQVRGI